ncbi:hypothetical protein H5V45_16325 [Nocardioides sp. KIGAM211]|uniref:Lipoprotein n=1 Tax=Nocardioides luti TaxID=2761101 RepID=A0A7X0RIF9_9ACTN|nr:hypothetical protein [Nocardioides luti]MBB6628896.1 hypothetical protein [Nocardioides luti]
MDLLTLRGIAAGAAGLVVLASVSGCASEPETSAPPAAGRPTGSTGSAGTPAAGPRLEPLRPDEVVVVRRSGTGHGRTDGVTGDLVILYAVCGSRGPIRVRTSLPRVAPLSVPCDGVVSRAQVYTEPGTRFRAVVDAPDATSWQLLVTRRDE